MTVVKAEAFKGENEMDRAVGPGTFFCGLGHQENAGSFPPDSFLADQATALTHFRFHVAYPKLEVQCILIRFSHTTVCNETGGTMAVQT